ARDVEGLEVDAHDAAAGHADVFLEAPLKEARLGRGVVAQQRQRLLDRARLDLAAADRAEVPPLLGDEHLRAAILRRGTEGVDNRDGDEGNAALDELALGFE